MTDRLCDGGLSAGFADSGARCTCGASFDDASRSLWHPHSLLVMHSSGGTITSSSGSWLTSNWPISMSSPVWSSPIWNPVPPNSATLSNTDLAALARAYSVLVNPGQKIVVCVDNDVTQAQIYELAEKMDNEGIKGIIIKSARAGTGYLPVAPFPKGTQDARLNILARIGFLWDQRPDLRLAELLAWFADAEWKENPVSDEDFAQVTEVHFKKIYGGIHGENT